MRESWTPTAPRLSEFAPSFETCGRRTVAGFAPPEGPGKIEASDQIQAHGSGNLRCAERLRPVAPSGRSCRKNGRAMAGSCLRNNARGIRRDRWRCPRWWGIPIYTPYRKDKDPTPSSRGRRATRRGLLRPAAAQRACEHARECCAAPPGSPCNWDTSPRHAFFCIRRDPPNARGLWHSNHLRPENENESSIRAACSPLLSGDFL